MDSIWQQHRTFILKILAGLGVCLLAWIVGSSLSGGSLSDQERVIRSRRSTIRKTDAPDDADTRRYQTDARLLEERMKLVAESIGETRQGQELTRGLIREILASVEREDDALVRRYEELARTTPSGCVLGLADEARQYLVTRAGTNNVLIDEDLGLSRVEVVAPELNRNLIVLKTIIDTMKLAVDKKVYEIKSVTISPTRAVGVEGEEPFIWELPVNLQVRGTSKAVLGLLEQLTDPAAPQPVKEIRRLTQDKGSRDEKTMFLEVEVVALWILMEE